MSNREILEKAVELAIDGGLKTNRTDIYTIDDPRFSLDWPYNYRDFIYEHDFAKALWGEEGCGSADPFEPFSDVKRWQFHLQRMVIADDPIAYLGENLPA